MSENATTVALFDVDGVLIIPGGYRRASEDTIKIFLDQLGQPHWQPAEKVYEHFESYMITSEWDMMPLLLCAFLEHALHLISSNQIWETFPQAAQEIQQQSELPQPENVLTIIDAIGEIVNGQSGTPSMWVLKAKDLDHFPFPLLRNHPVLENLLEDTRNIRNSLTMRTFQEHIIGSVLFEQYYKLKAEHHVVNYLTAYDAFPVNSETHAKLIEKSQNHEVYLSIYTARPSMPPAEISPNNDGAYSPEAEQALEVIPWENCYLSAYGKMYWLAQQCEFDTEDLLKPSPVQALSAIAYHFMDDEIEALMWAQKIYRAHLDGTLNSEALFSLPKTLHLHVFEDSPNGLRGGVVASQILRENGINVTLSLWGISDNPQKQTALRAQGGQVFTDINEAIQKALF